MVKHYHRYGTDPTQPNPTQPNPSSATPPPRTAPPTPPHIPPPHSTPPPHPRPTAPHRTPLRRSPPTQSRVRAGRASVPLARSLVSWSFVVRSSLVVVVGGRRGVVRWLIVVRGVVRAVHCFVVHALCCCGSTGRRHAASSQEPHDRGSEGGWPRGRGVVECAAAAHSDAPCPRPGGKGAEKGSLGRTGRARLQASTRGRYPGAGR